MSCVIHNQAEVTGRSTQNINFSNIPLVKLLKLHKTIKQKVKKVVFFFEGFICVLIFQIKLKKEQREGISKLPIHKAPSQLSQYSLVE